jgi:hypothetical protein
VIIAVVGLALLVALPLLANAGFLHTRPAGDSPNLLFRLQQLTEALSQGVFPVRWMPDAAYGYGYPFFNYYASLPTYLAALFKLYGFSYNLSIKLVQLAGFLLAAAGVYGWMRAQGARRPVAWLAAAAYTLAPFHLVNVYVRGDSLSEFWAMAWYPFVLWAAWRLARRPSVSRAGWLALVYGALVLTHNVSALTFTPFALLYVAAVWLRGVRQAKAAKTRRALALIPLALVAGLALSAFFWLPALLETQYVQTGGLTSGFFQYANHFRGSNLVQGSFFFDFNPVPTGGHTPFAMGLVQAVLAGLGVAAGAALAWKRRRGGRVLGLMILEGAIATFMITPLARVLWDHLPLLPLVQFPWRFLSIQALFAAALTGQIAELPWLAALRGPRLRWLAGGLAGALAVVLAAATMPPLHLDFLPLADADVTPQRLQWYEYLSGSIGSTVGSEYLPAAVTPRPFSSDEMLGRAPRLKVLAGEAVGTRLEKRAASQTWAITVTAPSTAVALPLYYWPGWQAQVDGQVVGVRAAPGLGFVALDLSPGVHTVRAYLGNTPLRQWTSLASLLAWLGLAGLSLRWFFRRSNRPARPGRYAIIGMAGLAGLFGGAVLLRHWPVSANPGPLNADFQTQAYFYPSPALFADGRQLTGYSYSSDALRPGDTFTITLDGLTDATLALASPATTLFNAAPFGSTTNGVMTIPPDLPPGLYFVLLTRPAPAVMPSGLRRSTVHLKPVVILQSTPAGESAEQTAPGTLRVHLQWTGRELPENYGLTLRLYDSAGNQWVSVDPPVAYGVYPTSLWRAGEQIADRYDLPLPAGTPPGAYRFAATLYDTGTQAPVETHAFTATLSLATPALPEKWPLTADLALNSVDAPASASQGYPIVIQARWITRQAPQQNYRARWTLAGTATVTQTLDLAPGSLPRQWPAKAFVLGRITFPIAPDAAPGDYRLSVMLVDEQNQPVGTAVALGSVRVSGTTRLFTVPPMKTPLEATFGDVLKLWGYDYAAGGRLTLAWGALAAPGRDYKFFVHLFNPADDSIVAQYDGMPHNYTYPTSHWAKGEVITDTVALDLTKVPAGDYRLAVGWYDDSGRLAALDARGQPLADDRLILPETIHIP